MRSISLRTFLVLLAGIASVPIDADALVPPAYDGIVVHVTFDGSGQTSRTDTASMPTYVATTDVQWHAEYDVTVPDVPAGFSTGLRFQPAGAGTTVTGTSHVEGQVGTCTGPITFNPHDPSAPTPFIGVYGGPFNFTADP